MLLEIIDLNVRYGGAVVLSDISINAKEGEIVTIIGNNGAGKTTTLRTISGMKRPISGEILFQGIKNPWNPGPRYRQNGYRTCSPREKSFSLHGSPGKHKTGRLLAEG